jgi:hypothetical protein
MTSLSNGCCTSFWILSQRLAQNKEPPCGADRRRERNVTFLLTCCQVPEALQQQIRRLGKLPVLILSVKTMMTVH